MKTPVVLLFLSALIVIPANYVVPCNGDYFHVDDFAGLGGGVNGQLVPINGAHSLWCGVTAVQSGYPSDGYGNNWDECWESCSLSVDPDSSIQVSYSICYDTEPGYDIAYFDYYNGANWTTLKTYNGRACITESITIPGPMSAVKLRFRFISDGAWSDQDGLWDTDGAVIIDDISVFSGSQLVNFEDFECEAVGDQRTLDGKWVAGPGGACLAGIPCGSDSTASVQGRKYNDENGNGIKDPSEPGMQGWAIDLLQSQAVIQTTTTDPQGDYVFTGLPPGAYSIAEVQQTGWAQTDPVLVHHAVTLQSGDHLQGLDFGNYSCIYPTCWDSCLAGNMDNFNTSDGAESTRVNAVYDAFLQNCGSGREYLFDEFPSNQCFGYTFSYQDSCMTGCWGSGVVVGARIEIKLKAPSSGMPQTDAFGFRENGGVAVWHIQMNALQAWQTGGSDTQWSLNDVNTFTLDLANLPQPYQGVTNILAALQDGDLNIYLQDDTAVDYIKLWVEVCKPNCFTPSAGLRGWWGGDGNTSDYSGYSNNGTPVGSIAYSPAPMVGSGALLFDGSSYVEVPDNASLDFGTATMPGRGNFSIDTWVRLSNTSGDITIITKLGLASFPFGIRGFVFYIANGKLGIMLITSQIITAINDNSGLLVQPNQWTHVAVTVDRDPNGPMVSFYMNGQQTSSRPASQKIAADISKPSSLIIGPVNANGLLDEVELFAGVLSPTDIMDMYLAGSAGKCHLSDSFIDCNNNGIDDLVDIKNGTSRDTNGNDSPDECELIIAPWGEFEVNFCCAPFGSTIVDDVWVYNVGGAVFSGTFADTCNEFNLLSGTGPYAINPGDSMAVVIEYAPASFGTTTCIIGTGFYPGIVCAGINNSLVGIKLIAGRASWENDHVAVRWTMGDAAGAPDFEIRRKQNPGDDFALISRGPVEQSSGGFIFRDDTAEPGRNYTYRITAVEGDAQLASFETGISTPAPKFALFQNYPNPFSTGTKIVFSLDHPERASVRIYDVTGRLVRTLLDGLLRAGIHRETWNGRDDSGRKAAAGIYFYRLRAGARSITKKAVILR